MQTKTTDAFRIRFGAASLRVRFLEGNALDADASHYVTRYANGRSSHVFSCSRSGPARSSRSVRCASADDALLLRVMLHAIELKDEGDALLCDRRRRQSVVKVAP
jgi:hypothetical protein